jgi:hypothetical protein
MADFSLEQLATLRRVIQETVQPLVEQAVAPLRADIAGLKTDVAEIKTVVDEMQSRQLNSAKGPRDHLIKVKSSRRACEKRAALEAFLLAQAHQTAVLQAEPIDLAAAAQAAQAVQDAQVRLLEKTAAASMPEFPPTMAHLLVAGNERLPFGVANPRWSKEKSRELLRYYGEDFEEGSDTEDGDTARAHRFLVAERIGISRHSLVSALSASVAANTYT